MFNKLLSSLSNIKPILRIIGELGAFANRIADIIDDGIENNSTSLFKDYDSQINQTQTN
jgi:hypothetical protein